MKPPRARVFYSGIELVEAEEANRPLIVGERTNVIGSRAVQEPDRGGEVGGGDARSRGGRCATARTSSTSACRSSDRDEIDDIPPFYEKLIRKIKAPIMIDTTDPKAVELALTYCQGKSIINSINLEDGEEKFERVCPVARKPTARRWWSAASTKTSCRRRRSRASASSRWRERSVALLTEKYGIAPEDIIIDPLVFPCATGDENYIGGAVETIEGDPADQGAAPGVKTMLGISNISFGLPAAAREVVNSVFLYYCTKAGLDLAIVNAEKLERFASIPTRSGGWPRTCCSTRPRRSSGRPSQADLLRRRPRTGASRRREQKVAINQFHIAAIAEHFRQGRQARESTCGEICRSTSGWRNYIIEGTKDGLIPDLDRKRAEGASPLEIINGPLMAGMAEVGRLFNNNELIVAEVLQSAEAMKAAVTHLEQFMEKTDSASARQDHPGHGEGRRPRHRQEPRRDHPVQQRLQGREPRHQGSARGR